MSITNVVTTRDGIFISYRRDDARGASGRLYDRRAMLQKGLDILNQQRENNQPPASLASWPKIFSDAIEGLK